MGDDFRRSGYDVETQVVNALEKDSIEAFAKRAASLGPVIYFIDTAGASPPSARGCSNCKDRQELIDSNLPLNRSVQHKTGCLIDGRPVFFCVNQHFRGAQRTFLRSETHRFAVQNRVC